VSKTFNGASEEGRVPPPATTRFGKGRSGNPRGRPKCAVSLERLTREFALKTQVVRISGKPGRMTRLAIAILKLKALAADGKPGAVALLDQLRGTITSKEPEHKGGVLIVPATAASVEEFVAKMIEQDKDKVEPGTEINVENEEFLKAVRGEPSPLGEAMRAFERKYSGR
jgi:uncharacterized protein DUF5681